MGCVCLLYLVYSQSKNAKCVYRGAVKVKSNTGLLLLANKVQYKWSFITHICHNYLTLTVSVFWDLRSTHEAIPLLCGLLFSTSRWFLQMLEPSLAILPRGPTVAMFTSTALCHALLLLLGFNGGALPLPSASECESDK